MEKIKKNNLILFFLITFLWSWFLWLPEVLWQIRLYLAPFGPFVAAFLLTYKQKGKEGILELLKRGIKYKVKPAWYLFVFLLMPVIAFLSLKLAVILNKEIIPNELAVISRPWLILYNFFYIFFLGGPLQEEFGWRGYALPLLQKRFSALTASVILGIIWAFWHLPLNFMATKAGPQYQVAISMFIGSLITMIFLSIIFTFLYNNTGGSIFIVLLFHTMINLSTYVIFPVFETKTGPFYYTIFIISTALMILLIYGRKTLTRKNPLEINT